MSLGSGDSVQEPLKVVVRLSAVLLVLVMLQGCATNGHGVRAEGSFENYVTKLRELGVGARPVQSFSGSIENSDQILSAALLELRLHPGAVQHRRVAERYRTLKILDAAFDHYSRARQLDRTDAASYDGLARIWRDWGFPHLGLADAARAVHYAPSWPAAHNTLGTILAAMLIAGVAVKLARQSSDRGVSSDATAAQVSTRAQSVEPARSDAGGVPENAMPQPVPSRDRGTAQVAPLESRPDRPAKPVPARPFLRVTPMTAPPRPLLPVPTAESVAGIANTPRTEPVLDDIESARMTFDLRVLADPLYQLDSIHDPMAIPEFADDAD